MIDFADRLLPIILESEVIVQDGLQLFNSEIEKSFISNVTAVSDVKDAGTTVKDAAQALHEKLLLTITSHPPSFYIHDHRCCMEAAGWGSDISVVKNIKHEDDEDVASNVAMTVAKAILLQHTMTENRKSKNDFRPRYNGDDVNEIEDNGKNDGLLILSEILRACKNLIRWYRFQLSTLSRIQKKHAVPSSGAVNRLCSIGMIQLYAVLLDLNSCKEDGNMDTAREFDESYDLAREAVARNASITIFHATYGPAAKTSSVVQKGLNYLVEPSKGFNWIVTLSRLLMSSHSVPVMLSLFRNVHNIVWSTPKITTRMNKAFEDLASIKENQIDCTIDVRPSNSGGLNVLSVLVSLLAWTIRSKPDFPGIDNFDRRSELATEILRVLFAIRSNGASITKQLEESNPEIMTQLGILLVDILHLPNKDKRAYECKLAVLALLMDPPQTYCQFLVVNKAIDPLLTILWLQLNDLLIVHGGSVRGEHNAAASILPVLVVLNKLSQFHITIKNLVKEYVFPLTAEIDPYHTLELQRSEESMNTTAPDGKNVKPIDAPPGTVRWKLIKLMTSIDSNVKRCASELLWTLCDGNSKEYVTRTGFGNAVHMLGIKGIVEIPDS